MSGFFNRITALFMSLLLLLGLAGPSIEIVTGHEMSVEISPDGVIERAYCTEDGCGETVELNVALPMKYALKGIFDCSDEENRNIDASTVLVYNSIDFAGYIRGLKRLGCEVVKRYSMGRNKYALLKHGYFTAYVSLLCSEMQLRVHIGKSDELAPPGRLSPDLRLTTPKLWQLSIDNEAAKANGGMGYVMQLSDGSFIVVDGGYETDSDARAIYDVIVENALPGRGKPVISAWFITHQHIDHYGAFYRFTRNYKDSVEIKAFYCDLPFIRIGDVYPRNCKNIIETMSSWAGAAVYRKVHSGMSFDICDAKITVICTFEDVYPFEIEDGNDTSLVFKVELGGQSILFTGDAEHGESDRMKRLGKRVLKSDIMQYPHHGYDKQCRDDFYSKVSPSVVLWPMPFLDHERGGGAVFGWRYEQRKENEWVRNASCVKKIVVDDEGLTRFDLPYVPEGDRICDYPV